MIPAGWIAAAALAALVLGLVMILGGRDMRRRRGLGDGKTVALDNVTLISRRYGLVARPDRLPRALQHHSGGVEICPERLAVAPGAAWRHLPGDRGSAWGGAYARFHCDRRRYAASGGE
jgi:hypothetical protein